MPKSVRGVMREFKSGQLHSGMGGPRVTKPKQAIAIALSEQRQRKAAPIKLSSKATVHTRAVPHPHRNLGKWLHKPK